MSLREACYVTPRAFVFAYMGLGEHDQAFAWLERGIGLGVPAVALLGAVYQLRRKSASWL